MVSQRKLKYSTTNNPSTANMDTAQPNTLWRQNYLCVIMCNHCQCLHIPGFLHLLSNTIQGIFLQEFMALDLHLSINSTIKAVSSSTNSKHLCKSQHFYVTMSNQKQLSLTFNSLPSDVWLALAKFQTFQGRLLIYKNNSGLFVS